MSIKKVKKLNSIFLNSKKKIKNVSSLKNQISSPYAHIYGYTTHFSVRSDYFKMLLCTEMYSF